MIIAKLSDSTVFLMTLFGYTKNFIIEHRIFQYLNCLKHVVSSDPFWFQVSTQSSAITDIRPNVHKIRIFLSKNFK